MQSKFDLLSFSGKSLNCYGLAVVKTCLERRGVACYTYSADSKNDVLFSIYWPEQIYDFAKFKYKEEMRDRKIVVGGNTATTNPSIALGFADYVFVGDGEMWNGEFDSPFLASKENRGPLKKAVAKHLVAIPFEDLQSTRRTFIEISRGCKNKCLFCQYGWLKDPYRETNFLDVKELSLAAKTKTIRCFAADRFQHSKYKQIRELFDKRGQNDSGSDVSLKFVLKNKEYLKYTKKIRVGIEGMSERLRRLIHKPCSDENIIEFCHNVAKNGIKSLDWYMIYGLPTENGEDIEAFLSLLAKLSKNMPRDYVLAIHWNAFTPSALTPFQWAKPAFHYPHKEKLEKIFATSFPGFKIYHKPKMTGDNTVLRRVLAIRASEKERDLIFSCAKNPKYFLKKQKDILEYYKRTTGKELVEEWEEDMSFPWDDYIIYPKEKFFSLYKKAISF